MTPKEKAAAMNFPAFAVMSRVSMLPQFELSEILSSRELHSMLGNSMFPGCLFLMILTGLVCFAPHDHELSSAHQ